jgi:serine/threonine protein kinase
VVSEKAALSCPPHPGIIRLYGAFSDEQHLYLATEIALGGELFALIEEMDALPETAVRYYSASVMLALAHLHDNGFIYRDLKPENLLLDAHGCLKVCDLGLAKRTDRTYSCVGTPQYISPELLRGEGATTASDWWALGVLIFEMLTGDLPFVAPDGSDKTLFELIKRGMFSWNRPSRTKNPARREPVSVFARDLVSGLLRQTVQPPFSPGASDARDSICSATKPSLFPLRFGAGPRGVSEIKGHKWFKGFDFDALFAGTCTPPYVPNLRGIDDDGNFGPVNWRGEPVLNSPEYDGATWDAEWEDGGW